MHAKLARIVVVLICVVGDSQRSFAQSESPPTSVILISIDTLRADHLSCYGYSKIHTPHIDSFAEGGTLFAEAEAQVPLTLPSHTSLFTSTYPFENRVEENGERVPGGAVTLASVLKSRGYKTAAFVSSAFLDPRYGLDQGFDEYDSPFRFETSRAGNPLTVSLRRDGALVVRAANQWLDAHRDGPVFVFVHLFDLHTPYTLPPEDARRQGISPYDAQLQYVDQVMGHFQQELVNGGRWQKSLVVVFGDHGEGLGEHKEIDHGYYVYESTLHVPLIIHWPQTAGNSKLEIRNSKLETGNSALVSRLDVRVSSSNGYQERFNVPVGLIDVAPTILDYLHVPLPPSFEGQSQLGELKNGEASNPRPVYSESVYAHDSFRWAPLRALRRGNYKYIQAPRAELYDLGADPHERVNLLHKNAAVVAELQNELSSVLARYAPSPQSAPSGLSPETLAQLESLGYLAAEPKHNSTRAGNGPRPPDPKDGFVEFELYQRALLELTERRAAAALPKFQSILRTDPQNTLARFHLGECYLQLQQPQKALREWDTVLKLDPQYAPAAEEIGKYDLGLHDYTKARLRFQQVVALTPESFMGHFGLAMADEHLGLRPEARAQLELACKINPHDENCARELKSLTQQ
jgi:arylsulfatase A-like enzyme